MSNNDVAAETESKSEVDTAPSRSVDLGLGIDIELEALESTGTDIELTFDEETLLEATDVSAHETPASDGPHLEGDERAQLEAVGVDVEMFREKAYSYQMLLDAGVDESTAKRLRRRFSLPWTFDHDGDLEQRSSAVRGLGAAEREWIAKSGDEGWQTFEYDESPIAAVAREKPTERPWPKPTPVTAVTGVGPDDADTLADAGIRSAERLATINAFEVASVLDLDVVHVRTWRHNARELLA
ncbi:hypothetical protein [Natronorubrum sulfidifaciens]|uniref:Helix-hairpin-helix domain-containing protein n=1 Tax=Natronorubrum sulfidifaciens JCM 14089 TaxID=1230460 RepID=L9W3G0_9EURY|nr:hypothetical protein [Natronorubrum sulfidifaciens]ELY43877.1 hypothetical protein C495_12470 [Natronorubrum sulfidifaciens JCM 14089]